MIVATIIPLSMLISFFLIQALGYTLNMIVLFSLMLALGMLVDNAIVIVENIYRHMQLGYRPIGGGHPRHPRGGLAGHHLDADHGGGLPAPAVLAGDHGRLHEVPADHADHRLVGFAVRGAGVQPGHFFHGDAPAETPAARSLVHAGLPPRPAAWFEQPRHDAVPGAVPAGGPGHALRQDRQGHGVLPRGRPGAGRDHRPDPPGHEHPRDGPHRSRDRGPHPSRTGRGSSIRSPTSARRAAL